VKRPQKSSTAGIVAASLILILTIPALAGSNESLELDMMSRIRQEAFRHSQIMQTLSELTDRIGPRLTGSPQMKEANVWAKEKLSGWGLANAHLESWGPFGRGWQEEFTSVRMVGPEIAMLHAVPRAWSPSTRGTVRGKAIRIKVEKEEDFAAYKGKLAGKIVLLGDAHEPKLLTEPLFVRLSTQKLEETTQYNIPDEHLIKAYGPDFVRRFMEFAEKRRQFLADERALVAIEPSQFDGGLLTMSGSQSYEPGKAIGVPTLNMAAEHYGRITRLLERNVDVELEVNVQTKFFDEDPMGYNTLAEIPGTDKSEEVVLVGAHMDSWHGGTGATDNGAGVAACMEAMRILKAIGAKPRRTIRLALWSGEEQGLLGSRAYVKEHLAYRPVSNDPKDTDLPELMRPPIGPLQIKPDYEKLAAYFNLDNGTGKVRGIYGQENAAVRPIFESWMEPLKDLGMTTFTMRTAGGTDHLSFAMVGLPGFQFIQDPADYATRTHHTDMDVYERLQRDDLMQQAVVMAWFAYNAAMREQVLPRLPLLPEDGNAGNGTPTATPRSSR
jgi:hypothetical protein